MKKRKPEAHFPQHYRENLLQKLTLRNIFWSTETYFDLRLSLCLIGLELAIALFIS